MEPMQKIAALLMLALLSGCLGMPEGVTPVKPFELERYLGTWYEVARLDHSFERGLSDVTATYTLREDGGVDVLNRGYSETEGAWSEARGRAYFVDGQDQAYLKVSFFGPFYGSYIVFELDQAGYSYAFVSGPDTDYLWLLAREPEPDARVLERFRERAAALGFDTAGLIYPDHGRAAPP
jgi:apolipoprotein D and lipocalin family protein